MHINLEADYAVRIVDCLAHFGQKMDAQRISEETGVSQRFTLKIMRKLVAAGLVNSYKGAHGGYRLSRAPGEITLRQAIEAVEGPYRFSRCLNAHYDCNHPRSLGCPFHPVFGEITAMVTQKLEETTFATEANGGYSQNAEKKLAE